MMTRSIIRSSQILIKRNVATYGQDIPAEFGNKLVNLFERKEYDQLVDEVERSPHGGDVNLMKLKVEALSASIIEKKENVRRTLNLINFIEKKTYTPVIALPEDSDTTKK